MPRHESQYPADWLRIAEKDWARVVRLLDAHDVEAAGFYLQQAMEKFIKAFLIAHGWQLRRTHDLELLLNDALAHEHSLERYRPILQKITGFYFLERYPFIMDAGLTEDEVRAAVSETTELAHSIRSLLAQKN